MSNKLYILFSAIIVSITMVGLFVATSKLQENKPKHPTNQITKAAPTIVKQAPLITTNNNDQALMILNMWYDLAADDDSSRVRIDEKDISHSRKVGVHSSLLSVIKPGYKIQLPSFIGDNYLLELSKIKKITDSEMVIYGELEANNETYFSTISIIENTLVAVLSTPKGDFDLKMIDGKGVIYRMDDTTDGVSIGAVIDQASFLE